MCDSHLLKRSPWPSKATAKQGVPQLNLASPCPAGQCASDDPLPPPHRGECRRSLHTLCNPLQIRRWCCPPPEHGCSAATPASWRLRCRQRVANLFSSCALVNANPPGVFQHHPLQGDVSRHRCRCCAMDVLDAGCRALGQAWCEAPSQDAKRLRPRPRRTTKQWQVTPRGALVISPSDAHSCRGKRTKAQRLWAGRGATALATSQIAYLEHVRCERQLRRQHMPWVTK